ncbi:MAG: rod shape-determining protein RodA [Aquificae bacterium]|nr:rod shape-determining protein RodA [Aquificota bacterium]
MRFPEVLRGLDWVLLVLLALIQIFGILAVYSASVSEGVPTFFKKHLLYIALSWIIIVLLAREKFRNILDLSLYIYLFNLFLLVLVLVMGKEVYGAKRWLNLGFINIQPSEFMKLSLILLTAYILPYINRIRDRKVLLLMFAYAIPAVVTLKQPDLGTTATYFVPLVVMLYFRGVKLRYFVFAGLAFLATTPILWNFLKDYQKKRILAVIDPYSDYLGSGYQLIQSVIAIGSGGLTGKGFLKGTQSQLMFLPEVHTDFIFSLMGEELGFVGTFVFVLIVFLFLLRILSYAGKTLTRSETLFVVGVFSILFFQYAVNILMTLGLFPVVGIPLPFVSFGGSSMLTFSIMVGILMSIYRELNTAVPVMGGEVNYE